MLFAAVLLSVCGVQALLWDGARPTENQNLPLRTQASPLPTHVAQLRERQSLSDNTCAWENGKGTSIYQLYCASQQVCATNSLSAFGCCTSASLDDCALITTCIDRTALHDYSLSYGENSFARSCTNAQIPNCITQFAILDRTVTGWGCGAANDARSETYYSTYWNATAASTQTPASYFNAVYYSYTSPTLISSSQSTTSTSIMSSTMSTSTTTTSTTPILTPTPTPTPTSAPSSPAPIGAIVGGTVGGIAVLGGLVVLALFLLRRSKQRGNNQPPVDSSQPPMQQPQGPQPPVQYPQYPVQPGYVYNAAPVQQPYPMGAAYAEKMPLQTTSPVPGSPEMSSPSSMSHDGRSSAVPPYSPMHELGV